MNATRCRGPVGVIVALIIAGTTLSGVAPAAASGPRLRVSRAAMLSALHCSGDLARSARRPVLFVHGTTSDSRANWSWNWARALDAHRWAHCELDLPRGATGDVQWSAEYVTRAIRFMHRRAGRRISIVGHSQGGMIARWSLKYWPDTRSMVDDYVGLAPPNHGTGPATFACSLSSCTAANWQHVQGSAFMDALNSGRETWPAVSYTVIVTSNDELVVPTATSHLRGRSRKVTNTSVQTLCPARFVEHFGLAFDNAVWLIGLDALTHRGPARLRRIDHPQCARTFMPGVDPNTFATDFAAALARSAQSFSTAASVSSEPPLRPYAR